LGKGREKKGVAAYRAEMSLATIKKESQESSQLSAGKRTTRQGEKEKGGKPPFKVEKLARGEKGLQGLN